MKVDYYVYDNSGINDVGLSHLAQMYTALNGINYMPNCKQCGLVRLMQSFQRLF